MPVKATSLSGFGVARPKLTDSTFGSEGS